MEESFHESAGLDKASLHALMRRDNLAASKAFLWMITAFFTASVCIVISWQGPWWQLALSHLFFGVVCCSIFACLHETAHNTAFGSKNLNKSAAAFCGIASVYPSSIFRDFHFQHHRYTHIPGKDPEISLGHKPITEILANLPVYFTWLSGLPFIVFKIFMVIGGCLGMPGFLRTRFFPFIRKESRVEIAVESWLTVFIFLSIFLLAHLVYPGFYAIFTGLVAGQCILSSYLLPEHNGLPHEGNIFEKTRSMKTGKWVRALMWNMPYHAEHHAYPAVPFHALPKLHALLGEEVKYKEEGYSGFHRKVLSREIS